MHLRLALPTALLALLAPAPALAGTVANDGRTITFTAAPGEVNKVSVLPASQLPGYMIVGDETAPAIAAGSDCQPRPAPSTLVLCRAPATATVVVTLGDGRDQFSGGGLGPTFVDGGEGDDTLHGSDADDTFAGGPGDDSFFPDKEVDPISNPVDTTNGRDVISGGDGVDEVVYLRHMAPLAVTLNDVADDGVAGEGDDVRSDVEEVSGSDLGPNVLIGSAAANRLSGGLHADVLVGGDGDDSLYGDEGDDRLDGGAGRDLLDGRDGNDQIDAGADDDTVAAGAGDDLITSRDGVYERRIDCEGGGDTLISDAGFLQSRPPFLALESAGGACERVELPAVAPAVLAAALPRRGQRRPAVLLACPGTACRGRVTMRTATRVRVGGRRRALTLGTARFQLAQASTKRVPLRPGRAARRAPRGGLRIDVTVTALPSRQRTSVTLVARRLRR